MGAARADGAAPTRAGDRAGARAATVAGAGAATARPGGHGTSERDVVELSPAKGLHIDSLDIDNRLGDVRVEGHDKDSISIMAVKHAPDADTLDRLKVSLVPDPDGPVTIRTSLLAGPEARPVPAGSIRIDLVVLAPRSARVQVQAWKGQVVVKRVDNGAELATDDGDIDVSDVSGKVVTHSAHGALRLAEIYGAIDAHALEGDLDLDVVHGDRLDAVVHAGQVSGRRIRVRNLSVLITRGNADIEVEAVAGGHYQVASYWGDVELRFRGAAPVRVRARSRAGEVSLASVFHRQKQARGGMVTAYAPGTGAAADVDVRTRIGTITVAEF